MVIRRFIALVCLTALGLGAALAGTEGRARADGTGGKVAGMVVSTLNQTGSPASAMGALAADGVNTVSLFVWWWTPAPSSNSLSPYGGTEADANLTADIAAAHAAGLKVILSPIFDCGGCQGGWRGVMEPTNVPAFFASYRSFMNHYAQLAQADNVWLLFVGSEMTSLEGQTAQWETVISSARQYYSGQIGYEQNWDVVGQPQFLSAVDVVGVSAYYPLNDSADPSEAQLLADWSNSQNATYKGHNWVGGLIHLAASTGKPILFGEVGYMASDYAASQPFNNNYVDDNQALQADLYQALLTTFSGYSWWMGVSWWEWSDASGDAPRTPKGKAAETLLRNWYANGWRPGSTSGSSGSTATTLPSASSPTVPAVGTGASTGGPASLGAAGTADSAGSPSLAGAPTSGPSPASSGSASSGHGARSSSPGTSSGGRPSSPAAGAGTTTDPTITPGQPYPLGSSSGGANAVASGSAPMLLTEGGGERAAVQVLGVIALIALAGTATAIPVLAPGGRRRRRPTLYEEFD